jgi:hypothetical protein
VQTGALQASSHISSLSWNLEGTRLLTGGTVLEMWHEKISDEDAQEPSNGESIYDFLEKFQKFSVRFSEIRNRRWRPEDTKQRARRRTRGDVGVRLEVPYSCARSPYGVQPRRNSLRDLWQKRSTRQGLVREQAL